MRGTVLLFASEHPLCQELYGILILELLSYDRNEDSDGRPILVRLWIPVWYVYCSFIKLALGLLLSFWCIQEFVLQWDLANFLSFSTKNCTCTHRQSRMHAVHSDLKGFILNSVCLRRRYAVLAGSTTTSDTQHNAEQSIWETALMYYTCFHYCCQKISLLDM